jgi:putative transposase
VGVAADGANRNDFKMAHETIESILIGRPRPRAREPQGMCLDKGYDYAEVPVQLKQFGFTAHIRARRRGAGEQERGRAQGPAVGRRAFP